MISNSLSKLDGQLYFKNTFRQRRHLHHRDNSKTEQIAKRIEYIAQRRSEPNPEYYRAPRSYVENYIKHHLRMRSPAETMFLRNPRYRWIDFRRRMVYGTYDI